jgi:hypothetical protein
MPNTRTFTTQIRQKGGKTNTLIGFAKSPQRAYTARPLTYRAGFLGSDKNNDSALMPTEPTGSELNAFS